MARTEKYFIGPTLLGEIRQTITRVAGMPERTTRVQQPTVHQELQRRGGAGTRLATFSGAWPVGVYKMVDLRHGGGGEVEVLNLFCAAGESCSGERWCAIFQDGGQWYLLAAECGVHQ